MTSPTDSDAPAPAQRDADSGWGMKIVLGVVGFILVVLLVLPGFLAAGFSRWTPAFFSVNGDVDWDTLIGFSQPVSDRWELYILAPSGWLMKRSQPVRRFYNWQYRIAGGLDIDINE